jgi:hypothetical protein
LPLLRETSRSEDTPPERSAIVIFSITAAFVLWVQGSGFRVQRFNVPRFKGSGLK